MHDPLVVAFEIPLPFPRRVRWDDAKRPGDRRWTWGVRRRTNPENFGERVYPWWRPKGYRIRIAGRAFALRGFVTIWHVEPGGRDSGEVCKWWRTNREGERVHSRRWAWHFWHWRLQFSTPPISKFKRFMWSRCKECGKRFPWNYAPVSHQWDGPGPKWFRGEPDVYHHPCSSLVHLRRMVEEHELIIRWMASAQDEPLPDHAKYRLERILDPEKVDR